MKLPPALFRERCRLRLKKVRRGYGQTIVDGARILSQLSEARVRPLELYLIDGDTPLYPGVTRYEVTPDEMHRLTDTEQPQAVAGLFALNSPKFTPSPMMFYLDRISDPGNLGTILRTAAAAGVSLLMSPEGCDPFNPKAIRASLGSAFYHPWEFLDEAGLLALGLPLIAADMTGEPVWNYRPPKEFVCVIGSEAHGVSETIRSQAVPVSIPLPGRMESLNAAIAAGVMMFALQAAATR
jgi:RNA methyltransferase, TrmH family